ncbi:methyltransferase domain-containing protein [Flectobacillus major]|uniref:methyltransferase domain-containing protein n=1 Tax=Flectobacillus major TaxID=103 RepID=UPI0004193011|nr:methyltransferase domain-containing protein [Flectobacillus major]
MQKSFETYQFQAGEVIASIGAASGVWEVGFASWQDGLTFYLQDIDPHSCNQEEVDYTVKYWEKQQNKTIQGIFYAVLGTPQATNLPKNFFDKVLVINSLHEILFLDEILDDINQILRPNGLLFIEETIAQTNGVLHEGCGLPLFTEEILLRKVEQKGFEVKQKVDKGNAVWIYVLKKSTDSST